MGYLQHHQRSGIHLLVLEIRVAEKPHPHQHDSCVESHIYLTLLAYQLVNTIRTCLRPTGLTYEWSNIRRIMATHSVQTIELSSDTKTIQLRKPQKPIEEVQQIYHATGCTETQTTVKNYVLYHYNSNSLVF